MAYRNVNAMITVDGATLKPGVLATLFSAQTLGAARGERAYDVARDGRFLISKMLDGAVPPITLIQNWNPDAKK